VGPDAVGSEKVQFAGRFAADDGEKGRPDVGQSPVPAAVVIPSRIALSNSGGQGP
jgi:hypothetical protein